MKTSPVLSRLFGRTSTTLLATMAVVQCALAQLPTVSIKTVDSLASEPGVDTAAFCVTRTGNLDAELAVFYTMAGTASNGVDYVLLPGSATIPPGSSNTVIVVQPVDDTLVEPTETVIVTLTPDPAYTVGDLRTATVYIHSNDTNLPPTAALIAPTNGDTFVNPVSITLAADASDPDGRVVRVEFFANNMLVGIATNAPYTVKWGSGGSTPNGAYGGGLMDGAYVLTARAVDNFGAASLSGPVTITVQATPLVRLCTLDSACSEPGTDTALVQISRLCHTNQPLTVTYTVGGTAINGVDYEALPGNVTLPAGVFYTNIVIRPIDDALLEPVETIILALTTNADYRLGDPRSSYIYLKDNETNRPPTVAVVAPPDGATFTDPTSIVVTAEAADVDGIVTRVEFFANNLSIGSATNAPYSVRWANMMQGTYLLTAKACDNLGAMGVSAPVHVNVARTPAVRIYPLDAYASEPGADTATVQVYRYYNTNVALLVRYTIAGTASNGADYEALPGSVLIPAGAACASIVIRPIDDLLVEPVETVILALAGDPAYALSDPRSAVVYIRDNDTNRPPVVALTAPPDGAEFRDPTNIMLAAEAADEDGVVARVDFMVNNVVVGCSTSRPYTVNWNGINGWSSLAPQGVCVLTARATDNLGAAATSQPVTITIVRAPIVQVYATDSHASEVEGDPGTFTIYRRENTNQNITVRYTVGGTASSGVDYTALPGDVTIPAGALTATVTVQPLDDGLDSEPPVETVALTLASDAAYRLGMPTQATVHIYNKVTTNAPPVVRMVTPTNGAAFNVPASVLLCAEAADPDGVVTKVDFLVNSVVIGSVTNRPYSLLWSNTAAGYFILSARATDNRGASTLSALVKVTATVAPVPTAIRYLPIGYVPGVRLMVMIAPRQPAGMGAYRVVDHPPTNWLVTEVSAGGSYNPIEGVVRFGPLTNLTHVLAYHVAPPTDETGLRAFNGAMVVGDRIVPITGASVLGPVPPHPADRDDVAFTMSLDEATRYCDLWKWALPAWSNTPTSAGANTPLVGYVARAGYLWRNGPAYTVSTNAPTPPPPMIWVINPGDRYTPSYATTGFGAAVAAMPTNYTAGGTFTVTLTVSPASTTGVYAVEERIPAGWRVSNISDDGVFAAGAVRWGLLLEGDPYTLSYDVTASTNDAAYATFSGVTSFDGVNVPITGVRRTYRVVSP